MAVTVKVNGKPVVECNRRCEGCRGALHHWIEELLNPDDPDPEDDIDREVVADWRRWREEQPDVAPECPIVWRCKHCSLWIRHYDECGDCGGPIDENGDCITVCGGTVGEY